jgi:hypothetical protein
MSIQPIIIAHPTTEEQTKALNAFLDALKIEHTNAQTEGYDPALIAKIEKGRKAYAQGEGTIITVEELRQLWK